MRFYPRNRKSRHDALVGPGHVAQHSDRNAKSRRDELSRYSRGNGAVVAFSGALSAADEATFQAGGVLNIDVTGDDRFIADAKSRLPAALIAAFATFTGLTVVAGDFGSPNGAGTRIVLTVPTNTVAAGAYSASFNKELFLNSNVAKVAALTISA